VGYIQAENFKCITIIVDFSSFVIKYLTTKLEKNNQPDTLCHPPAGCSRGLAEKL
jgi:hypothetical protein